MQRKLLFGVIDVVISCLAMIAQVSVQEALNFIYSSRVVLAMDRELPFPEISGPLLWRTSSP